MTTADKTKHREWTLDSDFDSSPIEASGPQFLGQIHVIEYQAYEKLQAELTKSEDRKDWCQREMNKFIDYGRKLETENTKLREVLERISSTQTERVGRTKLQQLNTAFRTIARKVLEEAKDEQ